MKKRGCSEVSSFERHMDTVLSVPDILGRKEVLRPVVFSHRDDSEDGLEAMNDREVFMAALRRRMNLLLGPRVVEKADLDIYRDDNVWMNEIRMSSEERKEELCGEKRVAFVSVDPDLYGIVANEIPGSGTKDDSFLYVRRRIVGLESRVEFLFRRSWGIMESKKVLSLASLDSLVRKDGFQGIVMVDGKSVVLSKAVEEVNIGLRNRNAGIMENNIRGTFTIRVDGLDGSGEKLQSVKLVCGYRESDFQVRFGYHKMYKVMPMERLMNYYLDNKCIPLGKLLEELVCISQPGSLRDNCLRFIELKASLFFGEAEISPYDVGSSLLFFLWMFGGSRLSLITNKIIEYIEYVLSELDICRSSTKDFLFLHETCIFINKIILLERQAGEIGSHRKPSIGDMKKDMQVGVGPSDWYEWDDFCPKESCTALAYYKAADFSENLVLRLRRIGHQEKMHEEDAKPIVKSTIEDLLLESLRISKAECIRSRSPGLRKLFGVYRRMNKISQKGLARFVDRDKTSNLIISILEENTVFDCETLLLCTILKDISQIVPVRVSVLDKALVKCISEVVEMFGKRLRRLLRKGEEDVENAFEPIRLFFKRLRYLNSTIHEEIFKSDLHHAIEEECFYRLRKISRDVRGGLRQLELCRKLHEEHLRMFNSMNREIELGYCLEEKKAFMRLYDVRKIKRMLRNPEILEKEILKMIGEGTFADDNVRNRYKLYLYECIKENARVLSKDRYDETMMSVNKCFI
ncbi:uncharacterized protein Eint_060580 [Encephalitozoon intestinalis ATCC 50506]|uniref:Uncharacterized protein n=1 Tax=Encephalitozoon intestinalis (strain ATCC 50506) TaxID=876142 RepID=E0S7I7_ENCIT|nr:uncharacterized protein Eint_060580 [Encephalitozoon intestinalis ATCC 50506]ADM11666.1 hypothetical protein Eint_060580 [Encephalitozoon intestinalis ATCC 50506]UTX45403.1 hypothetical protein GPK93_06g09550 [Encephalitozoon intestinalis]